MSEVLSLSAFYNFSLELSCMDASSGCQGLDKASSAVSHPAIRTFRQLRLAANAHKTL